MTPEAALAVLRTMSLQIVSDDGTVMPVGRMSEINIHAPIGQVVYSAVMAYMQKQREHLQGERDALNKIGRIIDNVLKGSS